MICIWCDSSNAKQGVNTVYWELPDGSRAITITETPCICCDDCGMMYQTEKTTDEIENQLMLIDTKKLNTQLTYQQLMEIPRWLKMNYFGK
ncbi:YokU family protein [Bacillus sp. BGMRC 2118]|nr:YokU family protein [Bacillus sp. BGMRC 2118]